MQEELLQFKLQDVWDLVDLPKGHRVIGTKWIFRNKKDERGIVIRNKARLVAQGYTQEEGINYDEVFAPVARVEAIRLFLAYASFMQFKVYQMDVKSAFLYGTIVYVCQPPGFENPSYPDRVYKLKKALYGLHQAPRAWYDTLSTYLLENGFERGIIDKTLFIKRRKKDILLVQIYVDDIIFGSIKDQMCRDFEELMHKSFKMSSMGELTFFLGLQVKQQKDGIFISQSKYVKDILEKYGLSDSKSASTPIETHKQITTDLEGEDVDVHLYRSMIGSLMYLTASRPDIMFPVCVCAIFQVKPKQSHLQVVKRIFRSLLADSKLPITFWDEAVNTACYVQNRVLVVKPKNKTPYELLNNRKPFIGFFKPFGCPCTILNTKTHLGKFDSNDDDGFLVGYSSQSKAYRVFNTSSRIIEESDNVKCNENTPNPIGSGPQWLFDIDSLTNSLGFSSDYHAGSGSGGSGDEQVQVQDIIPQSVIFPIPKIEPVDVCAKENMIEPIQSEEEERDEENQVHEEP
ncbi:hypothetical protein L6452_30473 [Arctium lappa]|uniref:Uncharacterized protein n=1 Tax=Arctium lappa TaxID=4217 RepID=A0ACB8ZJF9_ARCLA|nr:hypothetical protein L6452_30473 [Arctium lappa]